MVKAGLFITLFSSFIYSPLWAAESNIRFYKINKHQQTDKLWVSKKKSQLSGCHNFKGSPRIFKIVQVGYEYCSVYQQKDCAEESLVKASHKNIDASASKLQEGYGWLPIDRLSETNNHVQGVKLRSWKCL